MRRNSKSFQKTGFDLNEDFRAAWGVDIREAYDHVTDIFDILDMSASEAHGGLSMMFESMITGIDDFGLHAEYMKPMVKIVNGVLALITYSFYNNQTRANPPIIDWVDRDCPEYHIDAVFRNLTDRMREEQWRDEIAKLFSFWVYPVNQKEVSRRDLQDYNYTVRLLGELFDRLERHALPVIQSIEKKEKELIDRATLA